MSQVVVCYCLFQLFLARLEVCAVSHVGVVEGGLPIHLWHALIFICWIHKFWGAVQLKVIYFYFLVNFGINILKEGVFWIAVNPIDIENFLGLRGLDVLIEDEGELVWHLLILILKRPLNNTFESAYLEVCTPILASLLSYYQFGICSAYVENLQEGNCFQFLGNSWKVHVIEVKILVK